MQTYSIAILFLVSAMTWAPSAAAADPFPLEVNERFTQAADRTFKAFDRQHEQTWQHPFFFMQLADTQYGMFTKNKGFEQEAALAQQAVEHINRLRPRFVIVCGDLTNATPEHARYRAQVAQYYQDFSKVDEEIPLVCVCGNHDIGNRPTPKSIASYHENFGDDYFSFWVGGVCNVVLNSSVLKDPTGAPEVLAAQRTWLDQQLRDAKEANATHILLFQHHPLFLAKEDEPDQYLQHSARAENASAGPTEAGGCPSRLCRSLPPQCLRSGGSNGNDHDGPSGPTAWQRSVGLSHRDGARKEHPAPVLRDG